MRDAHPTFPRSITAIAVWASVLSATPPLAAQTESVDELLDRGLTELRTAEAGGPDAGPALQRLREILTEAVEQDPGNPRAVYYGARARAAVGRGTEAIANISDWVQSHRGANDWEAHRILGTLYLANHYYSLAKPKLQKAVQLNPRDAPSFLLLANCEIRMSRALEAIGHAREAIRLMADGVTSAAFVVLTRGNLLADQLDEADRNADRAGRLAKALIDRDGSDVVKLKALDEALELALLVKQKQLQADPTAVAFYTEMSQLMQQRAAVAEQSGLHNAFGILIRGLEAAGDRPPERMLLETMRLLQRLKRPDTAAEYARRLLDLYPGNPEARELLQSTQGASGVERSTDDSDPG